MTIYEALDRCVIVRDILMSGTDLKIIASMGNIAWITECAEAIESFIEHLEEGDEE